MREFDPKYPDGIDAEDTSIPRGDKWCEECRCLTNHTKHYTLEEEIDSRLERERERNVVAE
mgnify:CR=1 FL=1